MIIVSCVGDVVLNLVSWPGCHFGSWCVVLEGGNNDPTAGLLPQSKVWIFPVRLTGIANTEVIRGGGRWCQSDRSSSRSSG